MSVPRSDRIAELRDFAAAFSARIAEVRLHRDQCAMNAPWLWRDQNERLIRLENDLANLVRKIADIEKEDDR